MANAGISSSTLTNALRNLSGELTVGGVAMGAYEGDVTLEWEVEYDAPNYHGSIGTLENSEVVIAARMRLTVPMKEFAYANLQVAMGDVGYDNTGSSEKIGGQSLTFRKYVQNVVFTGAQKGGTTSKQVKITLTKAAAMPAGLTLNASTATAQVVFETRIDATAPRTLTGYIEIEK